MDRFMAEVAIDAATEELAALQFGAELIQPGHPRWDEIQQRIDMLKRRIALLSKEIEDHKEAA